MDIKPDPGGKRGFLEFPEDERLKDFDMEDRKFAAVAVKSQYEAVICNATDSDWWDYKEVFAQLGITIEFLTPDLIKRK